MHGQFSTRVVEGMAWLGLVALLGTARAEASPAAKRADFARDIRPILSEHCFACHGFDEKTRKGKLRLDSRPEAVARKAIVPDDARASALIERVESADGHDRMPPPRFKKPLSAGQKCLLRAWVEQSRRSLARARSGSRTTAGALTARSRIVQRRRPASAARRRACRPST